MKNRERGAAIVEFALIATLLLTILIGIFEGGRLWMVQASLSQAAREGAREMAITNNSGLAEEVITERATTIGVDIDPSVSPSVCTPGATVTATASASVESMTGLLEPLFGSDGVIPLTGEARMRCGG